MRDQSATITSACYLFLSSGHIMHVYNQAQAFLFIMWLQISFYTSPPCLKLVFGKGWLRPTTVFTPTNHFVSCLASMASFLISNPDLLPNNGMVGMSSIV